jgi:hypothetical protein
LREQGNPPRDAKELYNFRHSSLRTVVERAIGVLKMRFAYLRHRPYHDVKTHSKIILACCAIHNWLRQNDRNDAFFDTNLDNFTDEDDLDPGPVGPTLHINMATSAVWTARRDQLAATMWAEHVG